MKLWPSKSIELYCVDACIVCKIRLQIIVVVCDQELLVSREVLIYHCHVFHCITIVDCLFKDWKTKSSIVIAHGDYLITIKVIWSTYCTFNTNQM